MYFEFDHMIPFTASDMQGDLTLGGCIDVFQDAAQHHTDTVVPVEERKGLSRTWILSYWHIVFDRPLHYKDTIHVATWSTGYERMFAHRCYHVKDPQGETAVRAMSYWFLMDLNRGRPVRIKDDDLKRYEPEPPLNLGEENRKIDLPDAMEAQEKVRICRYMIDGYGHVNNAWYVRIAAEFFPEGKAVKELRVEYRTAALLGSTFYPAVYQDDGMTVVALNDENGKPYAIVEAKF